MKDVSEIFVLEANGLLAINKEEIRTIEEFAIILTRDKGSKGDHQGRKKLIASREFLFIKMYYHPLSIYRDLPNKVKYDKVVSECRLPDGWVEDIVVKAAGKKYVEMLNMSALLHAYLNANKAVYALGSDVEFFNERREHHRQKIIDKTLQLEATEIEEDRQNIEATIAYSTDQLMAFGDKITKINNSLPAAFDTVETLKQKLLKEGSNGAALHGGGKLGNREE